MTQSAERMASKRDRVSLLGWTRMDAEGGHLYRRILPLLNQRVATESENDQGDHVTSHAGCVGIITVFYLGRDPWNQSDNHQRTM